jgi:hypothetical protein
LQNAARQKEPVSLKAIGTIIDSALPSNSGLAGTFVRFVNDNEFEINSHIEPTVNSVDAENWVKVDAADESFKAKIYRQRIGAPGSGKPVEYDIDNNKLMVMRKLRKHLRNWLTNYD